MDASQERTLVEQPAASRLSLLIIRRWNGQEDLDATTVEHYHNRLFGVYFVAITPEFIPMSIQSSKGRWSMKYRENLSLVGAVAFMFGVCDPVFSSQRKHVQIPYLTTGLKCPTENAGILEQIESDGDGYVRRRRYKIVDNSVDKIIIETAKPGKGFEVDKLINVGNPSSEKEAAIGRLETKNGQEILSNICMIEQNRRLFQSKTIINSKEISRIRSEKILRIDAGKIVSGSPHKFKTVGARCPKSNGGILEQVRRHKDGYTVRFRYWVINGDVKYIHGEFAKDGEDFKVQYMYDAENPGSNKDKMDGINEIAKVRQVIDIMCENPSDLEKFNDTMRANRNGFPPEAKSPEWDKTLVNMR